MVSAAITKRTIVGALLFWTGVGPTASFRPTSTASTRSPTSPIGKNWFAPYRSSTSFSSFSSCASTVRLGPKTQRRLVVGVAVGAVAAVNAVLAEPPNAAAAAAAAANVDVQDTAADVVVVNDHAIDEELRLLSAAAARYRESTRYSDNSHNEDEDEDDDDDEHEVFDDDDDDDDYSSMPVVLQQNHQKEVQRPGKKGNNVFRRVPLVINGRAVLEYSSSSFSEPSRGDSGTHGINHNNNKKEAMKTKTTTTTTTTTTKKKKKLSSKRILRSVTAGLTRQEEVQLSFQIRTFRAAVRLREQLARQKRQRRALKDALDRGAEADEAAARAAAAAKLECYGPEDTALSSSAVVVGEREWASACGVSVSNLRRICQEGQEARSALVAANVGLVTSIARRHLRAAARSSAMAATLQDLIQEGNLGLMEAAERFDPERRVRLGTYATWWVRQRIAKSLADSSRVIRLPAHVHDKLGRIRRAKAEIRAVQGREPDPQELAHYLEMPLDKLKLYCDSGRDVVSLESPLQSNRQAIRNSNSAVVTLGETLASDVPTPVEDAEAASMRRDVWACLDSELTEQERSVLAARFGLRQFENRPMSVQETGKELGISRERVRLIETRALNKLRHPQRNYRLKGYLLGTEGLGGGRGRGSGNGKSSGKANGQTVSRTAADRDDRQPSREEINHPDRIWFF